MNEANHENMKLDGESTGENLNWQTAGTPEMADAELAQQGFVADNKWKNKNAMLLMGTCIMGMLGVYLLGVYQKPKEAAAEEKTIEAQIDAALAKFVDKGPQAKAEKLFEDTGMLVREFYEYPTKQQVALEELQKNPFSRLEEELVANTGNQEQARIELQKDLQKKLEMLKLQAVVRGVNGSICQINNMYYSRGQIVDETFLVKAISTGNVTLAASGFEFVLKM